MNAETQRRREDSSKELNARQPLTSPIQFPFPILNSRRFGVSAFIPFSYCAGSSSREDRMGGSEVRYEGGVARTTERGYRLFRGATMKTAGGANP
jgi:hypothetical protein